MVGEKGEKELFRYSVGYFFCFFFLFLFFLFVFLYSTEYDLFVFITTEMINDGRM